MRSADYLLATLSCPVGDRSAVQHLLDMPTSEVLSELATWLEDVFYLHPDLDLTLAEPADGESWLCGTFTFDSTRARVTFRVVGTDELLLCATDDRLQSLVDAKADVTALCLQVDPDDPAATDRIERLAELAGSPAPRWVVLEPAWLASGVVQKTKPFVYPGLQEANDTGEPYFRVAERGEHQPQLARSTGSTRRHVNEVLFEPRSLPEKVRELSLRVNFPDCDVTLVTSFIPPVAHSTTAVARYYSRDGSDVDLVAQLVAARQQAEREGLRHHLAEHRQVLILDRQEVEDYFVDPEYYQMTLTPDELDEIVVNITGMLEYANLTIALCPDAIDVPFRLEGRRVELRGDRRNRSEPRPGRVNGVTLVDERLAEELRREASSLLQVTEPQFKDKTFIASWLDWLAKNYRKHQRRRL